MEFGYFNKGTREYVITRPDTPTPWINYLGQKEYCALVSNTGGGYSFFRDPRERRITRYRYNSLPADRPGRYVYLRDNRTGRYWSATWQPTCGAAAASGYECRHGLGYTAIRLERERIVSSLTYFVPAHENLEVWLLGLVNLAPVARQFSLFSYVEFCLWQAVMDMQDFQYSLNISRADCLGSTIYHLTPNPSAAVGFFSTTDTLAGFDTDREAFIGNYRDESAPAAVEEGRSRNSRNRGGNPIGSHHLKVTLAPGAQRQLAFVLGVAADKSEAQAKARRFTRPDFVRLELERLKAGWLDKLGNLQVETPDGDLDLMINTWNQYQCRTTFNWARSASYYESGIGRAIGFRDANQDTLGLLHVDAAAVKARILDLAANQFSAGDSFHQYFPLTKKGDRRGYSDDHLWLVLSTAYYIRETADLGILASRVAFADRGSATLYDHLLAAIRFSARDTGRHGLPLLRYADWNDCLNNTGSASESVWVAQFFCYASRELAALAGLINRQADARRLLGAARCMARRINRCAWDGNWYVRMFDQRGRPVGSKKCRQGGAIYLNTQSWAVLSAVADRQRALRCLDAARHRLLTRYGLKLMAPAYRAFDPSVGAIGTFSPGLKENGGIFCHANPWAVIAETMLGRGDLAFDYYRRILPAALNGQAEVHKTEPYVYSQFFAGDESPEFGRARNSWLTGSAAWNFVAATCYILGVRPQAAGLTVDPCIPRRWKGFIMQRSFRGRRYHIEVRNPSAVSHGVQSIEVDGRKIRTPVLPLVKGSKACSVKVTLG